MTSAVETDAKLDSVPVCAVCADVSDGLHFSVLSCRACAAFFRRTVSLKLTYKCRNESNCKIEKTARNMCRHCRFQKCLNVGMLTSAVQQTRDGIGKRGITQRSVSELQDLRFSTTEIPSSSTGNQTEGWSEVQKHTPLLLNRTQTHTVDELKQKVPSMEIIPKMVEGYRQLLSMRKATQSIVDNNNMHDVFSKNPKLKMSSYSSAKKVCEMEVQLVTNIINDYFPPFKDLPFDEKVALFRNFLCHFSISDRAYQSYLIFGMNKSDDRLLMSDGGYIKTTELAMFYKDSATRNAEPEEAARIFLPAMTYIVNVILGHMKRISITDVEFMVVVAMFLWDDALSTISEQTQSIICDTRDKIFAELNSYYKSLGMTDQQAAVRMGNLLILLPKMQQSVKMYRENCELAELFNILEVDQCGRSFKPE